MRKIFLLVALLFCVLSSLQAQKLRLSDIPQEVRMGLENTYTDYKLLGWYFETGQYVAEIDIDSRVGRVFFTASGNWQFTIFNVSHEELPTLVANYFINNYPGYRIKKSEYVEDFGGDNYYRLVVSMKGIGQTEYEMIFDTRGKMIKTNAPDPDYVKKDYIERLNPEDIERQQKKMAERTALPGTGLEVGDENYVKANKDPQSSGKDGRKVDIEIPAPVEEPKIPEAVNRAFEKKYPRIEVQEWQTQDTCYNAVFKNRQKTSMEALFMPDGSLVSVTTLMKKDRYPRLIMSDLAKRYPDAKVSLIQKVEYDAKYRRSVTDRKLEQYFYIELTEKIRGKRDVKTIKLLYDKSFKYQGLAGNQDDYEEEEEEE
ncbi:MAG: PepSY-like domain-containing protein [Bacteroidales bacterium]|jgi:hypothetical protein|nr:PepSY-like domain-containing protein [Bacteroidales bacterium]